MSPGEWAALVLLLGVFAAGLWMASTGVPRHRLVGLEFAGIATITILIVLAVSWQQPSSLIIPLVLVAITFPGTLVYTRLLVREK